MAHLKITFLEEKNLTGCLSYRPRKGQKGTFWTISALEHSKVCTLFDFGHLQFFIFKILFTIMSKKNVQLITTFIPHTLEYEKQAILHNV
jgi:hypothetical protein